jgi:hypothetical protein
VYVTGSGLYPQDGAYCLCVCVAERGGFIQLQITLNHSGFAALFVSLLLSSTSGSTRF